MNAYPVDAFGLVDVDTPTLPGQTYRATYHFPDGPPATGTKVSMFHENSTPAFDLHTGTKIDHTNMTSGEFTVVAVTSNIRFLFDGEASDVAKPVLFSLIPII